MSAPSQPIDLVAAARITGGNGDNVVAAIDPASGNRGVGAVSRLGRGLYRVLAAPGESFPIGSTSAGGGVNVQVTPEMNLKGFGANGAWTPELTAVLVAVVGRTAANVVPPTGRTTQSYIDVAFFDVNSGAAYPTPADPTAFHFQITRAA